MYLPCYMQLPKWKYLASNMNDLAITCDEIIDADGKLS